LLIADDHAVVRRLLRMLLESREGWQVCGEAENGSQAIAKALELRPDLIIMDLAMPLMDGLRAAREISTALPAVPILMHTMHMCSELALEAKKAGIRRVVSKTSTGNELFTAVEELLRTNSATLRSAPANNAARAATQSADSSALDKPAKENCKPN